MAFVILKNHTSATVRKEKLIPTSEAKREPSRNEFVEKSGVPDRVKALKSMLLLLLLITRPLPGDGGMAEDHGAPEAGQLPRVWTRGRKETKSRQRVSGAKSP